MKKLMEGGRDKVLTKKKEKIRKVTNQPTNEQTNKKIKQKVTIKHKAAYCTTGA